MTDTFTGRAVIVSPCNFHLEQKTAQSTLNSIIQGECYMASQKVAVVITAKKYYRSVKQVLIVSRKGGDIVLMRQTLNSEVEFESKLLVRGSVRKLKSSRYSSDCWMGVHRLLFNLDWNQGRMSNQLCSSVQGAFCSSCSQHISNVGI